MAQQMTVCTVSFGTIFQANWNLRASHADFQTNIHESSKILCDFRMQWMSQIMSSSLLLNPQNLCLHFMTWFSQPYDTLGDTLFIAACGKFFEGTPDQMYEALIEKLGKLPTDTVSWSPSPYCCNHMRCWKYSLFYELTVEAPLRGGMTDALTVIIMYAQCKSLECPVSTVCTKLLMLPIFQFSLSTVVMNIQPVPSLLPSMWNPKTRTSSKK